jgi:hypothetical protein
MFGTPENDPLLERLRTELTRAETDLDKATTPEAKKQIVDRLRKALADFSCQVHLKYCGLKMQPSTKHPKSLFQPVMRRPSCDV